MRAIDYGAQRGPPPTFDEAKNRRQRVRASGMDPNYWYAVEQDKNVAVGELKKVVFWKQSIVLLRGTDGKLRAIEDRCAHRQLPLSEGNVKGCHVQCAYHGWTHDGAGEVVDIPHHTFGHDNLKLRVRAFDVRVRYGLIWIFPGDPALADQRQIPNIPQLEGADRWASVPLDFLWHGHHSMVIDNVSDLTHGHLHRRYEPFKDDWRLLSIQRNGDRVDLKYDYKIATGKVIDKFVHRDRQRNLMDACYQYPYHWSKTDDFVGHWLFVLPIDERTTRCFFLFYYRNMKVPFLPLTLPNRLLEGIVKVVNRTIVGPLLQQDGDAIKLEQDGYDRHWDKPIAEVAPIVTMFQDLTIDKWQAYLQSRSHATPIQIGSRA